VYGEIFVIDLKTKLSAKPVQRKAPAGLKFFGFISSIGKRFSASVRDVN
jgi:hypothetical protein